jgi:hypothetical protein
MTGVYITCVSGLIDLLGWDMLLMLPVMIRSDSMNLQCAMVRSCSNILMRLQILMFP